MVLIKVIRIIEPDVYQLHSKGPGICKNSRSGGEWGGEGGLV